MHARTIQLTAEEQAEADFYDQAIKANKALREAVLRLSMIRATQPGTMAALEADEALCAVKRIVEGPALRILPDLEVATGDTRR